MRLNNPVEAALWELNCIWPGNSENVVLSIGTGHREFAATESWSDGNVLSDGFIPRILRAFLSSPCLDGESAWRGITNRLTGSQKSKFFRLGYQFQGEPPSLDDSTQVHLLRQMVGASSANMERETLALWASMFFMELTAEPVYMVGQFTCKARVLCRFADARSLVELMNRLYRKPQIMIGDTRLINMGGRGVMCAHCGHFEQPITFDVRQLDSLITLSLAFDKNSRNELASFPKSVKWFLDKQLRYGQWFEWPKSVNCCRRLSKRALSPLEQSFAKRRKVV